MKQFKRVAVIGTSCSGKTTFAKSLSKQLNADHIELDSLYWRPNWVPENVNTFRATVENATNGQKWVADGNYSKARDIVWCKAEAIIWLNYPFPTVFKRAIFRTVRRVFTREELYSNNRETFAKAFLSTDSILWWVIKTHHRRCREYPILFKETKFAHLQIVQLLSPKETANFLSSYPK